jgi:hypothetical protein
MKRLIITLLIFIPLYGFSQKGIYVKKSESDLNIPQIVWATVLPVDSNDFRIYRANIKDKKFEEIHTVHYVKPPDSSGVSELWVFDTTLTEKAVYLYWIKIESGGKAYSSATAIAHNYGYIESPRVLSFESVPLEDRKAVRLNWKVSSPQLINSFALYRSRSYDTGYVKIADIAADRTEFTDVIPLANEPWFYYLEIHNWFGGSSKSVSIPAFATFAEKPIPPQNMHWSFKNDTVFIDWKNVSRNIIGYRVYRSVGDKPFMQLKEMQPGITEKVYFTDQGDVVSKALRLRYFVRNVSDGFLESNSSDTATFYLPEHKPVFPPDEVDYVILPGGTLKLLWMPPKKGLTLSYNVYLTTPDGKTEKLNATPLAQNVFTDTLYRSQGKYLYQVEGVGMSGKLSEKRAEVAVYRKNPPLHAIIDIKLYKEGLAISWKKVLNPHITGVALYKQSGNSKPVLLKRYERNSDETYYDKDVVHGNSYQYILKAETGNGETIVLNDGVQMYY